MFFSKRTSPDECAVGFVGTVRSHPETSRTDGGTILVNPDGIRDGFGPSSVGIQIDKGRDAAVFEKAVSRVIVHGGIETDIVRFYKRHMLFQFMKSDQKTDGIMSGGTGETQKQRDIHMEFVVMAGKMKQGITEVVFFKIGVIAPCGIRVGIMAWRELVVIHREKMFWDVSIGRSMGMDSSAITGNGKDIGRDNPAIERRDDSNMVKKLLKESLKIEEDVLILKKAVA